jgi:hypothetical protein
VSLNNVLKKKQIHFQFFLLTIKLNYLHDLKIMLQCLVHLITYIIEITPNLHAVTTFVAEIGVPREIHRSVASHWQTLSDNVLSSTPRHEWGSNSQLQWW